MRYWLLLWIGILLLIWTYSCSVTKQRSVQYQYPELFYFPQLSEGNKVSLNSNVIDLGRHLFYDPVLSLDSSLACAGCHKQSFAFSDGGNAFSSGFGGKLTKRNAMPLFNLVWYSSFFWDGKAATIEEQVFHPVRAHDEMNLQWPIAEERIRGNAFYIKKFKKAFGDRSIDSTSIAEAIAQFERTLISANSRYDSVLRGEAYFTGAELRGFDLMNNQTKGDCLHCHTTDADALGTTAMFSNNGLDPIYDVNDLKDLGRGGVTKNKSDAGHFRIPSVRNLAFTAPYMHDGRFSTIDEVLDFYSEGVNVSVNIDSKMGSAHQGGAHLTEQEKADIKAFLMTMNDYVFVKDSRFSDPLK